MTAYASQSGKTPRVDRPPPKGFQKRLMGLPVWFYRRGLGRLFGSRLVVLVHKGRKTGKTRYTTFEVLEHRLVDGEYRVLSGWGRTSDWFRNIQTNPPEALWVGKARRQVNHRQRHRAVTQPAGASIEGRHLPE